MNEEILKLAKEFFADPDGSLVVLIPELKFFYRAAYNKAIQDAVKRVAESDDKLMAEFHIERIRELEMK